jgi:hypothetical protein
MEDEDLFWMRNNTRISQDRDAATYLGVYAWMCMCVYLYIYIFMSVYLSI